jgi:hypothetical protein
VSTKCSAALGVQLVTGRPHRILDPAAGSGIYGELLRERFPEAVIPRPAAYDGWAERTSFQEFAAACRNVDGQRYHAIVTNPPYRELDQFVELAWRLLAPGGEMVFLTQLRYLEGQKRARPIWGQMVPREIVVLTQRLSFQADSKTSPAAYCYVGWQKPIGGRIGLPVVRWAVPELEAGE